MKQSFEDFIAEYATVSNALTYDKMEDKIYHLANITGLHCDHSRLYKLEDRLLEILDEIDATY